MSLTPSPKPVASKPGPAIEPLWSIDDVAAYLSCSRRLVERERSAGRFPPPHMHIGRMPRWKAETIRDWTPKGGRK